jgi:mono/diheme cytochrome c family protein
VCAGFKKGNVKIKTAIVTVFCLMTGVFFAVLRAQPSAGDPRAFPSSDGESRSVWDGVYTEDQAKRGLSLYRQECAPCHGETLEGGDEVPPLAGAQFLANWSGLTVGDLFERIRKSMPQNDPGKLASEQYADILTYLLRFNNFPAGKAEMAHETEVLKQIRIEATKPDVQKDK